MSPRYSEIQPGSSVKDLDVIAANDAGLTMMFTGMRHFRHEPTPHLQHNRSRQ